MEKLRILIIDDDRELRMAPARGMGRRALEAGTVAYFQKPIDINGLWLEIARRATERRAG